ncbi:hypothetical protein [Mameliella sp. MMSF_3455]|nr:hypothetical protein [Mameliella sp. MMSF_3455]
MRIEDLPDFWSKMPLNVHPRDEPHLRGADARCFNLDYPPPAFVGDIVNAKVIILLLNGGYDRKMTPAEFPDPETQAAYRNRLAMPRPIEDRFTSPYHLSRNYTPWLKDGRAALLNAVAYRSIDIKAPCVRRLSKDLPSAIFHREWLREALWPEVRGGQRFVVVHRWSLWNGADNIFRGSENAVGWQAAISKDLTKKEFDAASDFLAANPH